MGSGKVGGDRIITAKSRNINGNDARKSKKTKKLTKAGRTVSEKKDNNTKKNSFSKSLSNLVGKFKKPKDRDIEDRVVETAPVKKAFVCQQKVDVSSQEFGYNTKKALESRNKALDLRDKELGIADEFMDHATKLGKREMSASSCASMLDSFMKSIGDDDFSKQLRDKIKDLNVDLKKHEEGDSNAHKEYSGKANEHYKKVKQIDGDVKTYSNEVKNAFECDRTEKIRTIIKDKISSAKKKSDISERGIEEKKANAVNNEEENKQKLIEENNKIKLLCNQKSSVKTTISKTLHAKNKLEKRLAELDVLLKGVDTLASHAAQSEKELNEVSGGSGTSLGEGVDTFVDGFKGLSKDASQLKATTKKVNEERYKELSEEKAKHKEAIKTAVAELADLRKKSASIKKENIDMIKEIGETRSVLAADLEKMSNELDEELDAIESEFLKQESYLKTKITAFENRDVKLEGMGDIKKKAKVRVAGISNPTQATMKDEGMPKKSIKKNIKSIFKRSVKKDTGRKSDKRSAASSSSASKGKAPQGNASKISIGKKVLSKGEISNGIASVCHVLRDEDGKNEPVDAYKGQPFVNRIAYRIADSFKIDDTTSEMVAQEIVSSDRKPKTVEKILKRYKGNWNI